MPLIKSQDFNLVPSMSPLLQQLNQAIQKRSDINRQDRLLEQKEQANKAQAVIKTAGAQALRVRNIKDFTSQRKEIAIMAQNAIKRGEDPQQFVDALNIQNQDEFNLNLTRIATAAGNAEKLIAEGLREEEQFEPVLDAEGNVIAQRNVQTGEVIKDPRAIARAKAQEKVGLTEVKSSKILDDGTVIQSMKDGSTRVVSSVGGVLSGDARTQAIKDAQEFGVDIQQRRAKGRELGKGAGKIALNAFDKVAAIRENVLDYQRGIDLIEKEGATTGFIADFLPNMKASTRKFANLRRKLGLNVVASVTFGALSEGELNLAMDVALPKGISPEATVKWIEDRMAAQQKLADNLEDAALYLADHSVAELIRRNRAMAKAAKNKEDQGGDGLRQDGTQKQDGFFGRLKRPDGKISTEISIGVNIGGKEVEIPTLVPTLTLEEKNWLVNQWAEGTPIPREIQRKAVTHAEQRIRQGKSPFWAPGDPVETPQGGIKFLGFE